MATANAAGLYRPRRPELTVLYCALAQHFERFVQVYDERFAFPCKLCCICPSCRTKRELVWAQWAAGELLEDVLHRQVVFTIPKRPTIARSCSASREERAMSSPSSTPELATNRSSQLTNRRNSRMLE